MIPSYQELMLPILEELADGNDYATPALQRTLAQRFSLTQEEVSRLLPSGRQTFIKNRIGWAQTYLKKAGLLETPKRGTYRLTPRGREILQEKPTAIDAEFLMRYPEFAEFRSQNGRTNGEISQGRFPTPDEAMSGQYESTPEELMELGYRRLRQSLAD